MTTQLPIDVIHDAIVNTTGHHGRSHGGSYQLRCPAHHDRNPSLSLTENQEHHALIHCHGGCSTDEVLAAIGKTRRDLYPDTGDTRPDPVVATYRYLDEHGELQFEVQRTAEKKFRQRRPDPDTPGGWIWNLNGVTRVLYRLPLVLQAILDGQTIYLVEGEKDVHTAENLGHVATCNPGGAGKWRPEYTRSLRGAHVVIIADNDRGGQGIAHARAVARELNQTAASLVVTLPTTGKDLTDLITAGMTIDDLTIVEIDAAEPARPTPTDTRTRPSEPDGGQTEPVDDTPEPTGRHVRLTPATAFPIRPVRWVWDGWMALGEICLIGGREGVGKSTLLAKLAAEITRGSLPGIYHGQPRTVLYAASEDSWGYTIAPRMIAAGADLTRVYRIDVEDEGLPAGLNLPRDVHDLAAVAHEHDAAVLMCDPILSLVDQRINPNHSKELRTALEPLRHAAEEAGIAIPALVHYNKTRDIDANSMIAGSRAWTEVARMIISIAHDEDAGVCVVSQTKNNLGRRQTDNLTYTLQDTVIESNEGDIHVGRLVWGEHTSTSAEAILQRRPPTEDTDTGTSILNHLRETGRGQNPRQIADATGLNPSTIRVTLRRMLAREQIRQASPGIYLPPLALCSACNLPMLMEDTSGTHPTCRAR